MNFLAFLENLSTDKILPGFTDLLISSPSIENNFYYHLGDRWCAVEALLKSNPEANKLLKQFAYYGLDPEFSFSVCNLKTQYIPDEDFINNGSAIVIYALTGSSWIYVTRISDQLSKF